MKTKELSNGLDEYEYYGSFDNFVTFTKGEYQTTQDWNGHMNGKTTPDFDNDEWEEEVFYEYDVFNKKYPNHKWFGQGKLFFDRYKAEYGPLKVKRRKLR